MRGRTVLILLILVVGLVAFIELYEHELPSSEDRKRLQKLVLEFDPDDIEAVELAGIEGTVRLERLRSDDGQETATTDLEDSHWQLVEPLTAPADTTLVLSLMDSLVGLEKQRVLENVTAGEVGLETPRMTVRLVGKDREWQMAVGAEVPAGNRMMVALAGEDEILVVEDSPWAELNRRPGDWRSRRILEGSEDKIQTVVLESDDNRLTLARRDTDFWLEQPLVDRADPERVAGLLAALATATITEFADEWSDPSADPGLDPPQGTVTITRDGGASPLKIVWGRPVPQSESRHYAGTLGMIFSTDANLQEFLDLQVDDWQSRELISLEPFQIDSLEVAQAAREPMSLSRQGANWSRNEDQISFPSVSDLLYSLTDLQALYLLSQERHIGSAAPLSEPLLEVKLRGGGQEQSAVFHEIREEGVLATVEDRRVVLLVGSDEFTEILANVERVRRSESVKTAIDEQLPSTDTELSSDQ